MQKKIILAGLAILGSIQLSAYTYEVSPLIGKNFTENNSLVGDSTAYGIRVNKYISEENAIMFGYTRLNDAHYKSHAKRAKNVRSCPIDPCKPIKYEDENQWDHNDDDTGSNTENGADSNSNPSNIDTGYNEDSNNPSASNSTDNDTTSSNSTPGNGARPGNSSAGNNTNSGNSGASNGANTGNSARPGNSGSGNGAGINRPNIKVLGSSSKNTDINRFYINGLHNIKTKYSRLLPYVYGGFGYEYVDNEFSDNKSQGFFNAGGGLKFRVNDRFNLVSDVQGVKKFSSNDLDILGSLGVSFLFGKALQPEPEALVASGLEDIQPEAPKRNITIVKVASQPVAEIEPYPIADVADATPIIEDTITTAGAGEYYVQVAAGFQTDMETGCKHTKDLRNAGIDYDIKYGTINGKNVARVVVGPFETKKEAASYLPELRKFSKDAFVKRIKN